MHLTSNFWSMKDYNKYWEKEAKKRRKSWEDKLARKINSHMEAEEIREDVYKTFDKTQGFSYYKYEVAHFTQKNPLVEWKGGVIHFSESGLREALLQQGANLDEFKYEVSHSSVKDALFPNVEIINISYGKAIMAIKRFSTEGVPFGFYTIVPTTQLASKYPWHMEETRFYTLDIATLLMEMDGEMNLREEELMYYLKGMKLLAINGLTIDELEYQLWEDEEIPTKVQTYLMKKKKQLDFFPAIEDMEEFALRPWMKAVKNALDAISHADRNNKSLIFSVWEKNKWGSIVKSPQEYVESVLRPYLDSHGLQEAKAYADGKINLVIEYKNCRILLKDHWLNNQTPYQCHLYPIADDEEFFDSSSNFHEPYDIKFSMLTLSAIAWYIKQAPEYVEYITRFKKLVQQAYNEVVAKL